LLTIAGVAALTPNAYAYLDPGTGSLVLQLTIGAFLGALLTAKYWWARLKMFIGQILRGKGRDAGSDE
jgi:hypothetical protein